jgi:hypothetical protein
MNLSSEERRSLESMARKYTSPYCDVIRAKIMLLADENSEIRFFARVSWRGRIKTSEVRRLLSQYRGTGLAPDPGRGQFQAKVLLDRKRVRRLAGASGCPIRVSTNDGWRQGYL